MYKAYKNKWTKLLATLMDLFPYHSICRHCFICYQEFEMKKKLLQCCYMYRYIIDDSMPAICFARVRCDHTVQSRPIHNRLVLDQYNNSDTTLGRLKFLRDLPTKLNIIFLRKKKNNISSTLLKYKFSFRIQCIIWIKLIAIFPYRALFWKERFILWMFICITF